MVKTLFLLTIVAANPFSLPNETLNYKSLKYNKGKLVIRPP